MNEATRQLLDGASAAAKQALFNYLLELTTPAKRERMQEVLDWRTRYLTVVLEDIYHPHNASACVRSCECFGIQDLHIIEEEMDFRPVRHIGLGANQWLSLHHHTSTEQCLSDMKAQDYHIAAMTLREGSIPIQQLPITGKIALCFGTEETGLSETAHGLADSQVYIPMQGFTRSFNISVTVALALFELGHKLRATSLPWQLSSEEKRALQLDWLVQAQTNDDILVRNFLERFSALEKTAKSAENAKNY